MKKTLMTVFAALVTIMFSGCATTELQSRAVLTKTVSLSPNVLNEKKVFLRVTGTEASILKLKQPLEEELKARGVQLVKEEDANIFMHVNTLFANNLKEAVRYREIFAGGTVAGVGARLNGNSGGDSILIGVGVAIAMGIADRALADETYRAIIDISLRTKDNNAWSKEDKTRVLAEAIKMGLDVEEARPILEKKAVYKIAEILK